MSNIETKKFSTRDKLFSAVAKRCEEQLKTSTEKNGQASFIIPGGTTPAPAFKKLANSNLDWKNITIAQSDERWVEPVHPQSNQGLTAKTLLIDNASVAGYIAMKNTALSTNEGLAECNQAYHELGSPFSLTMLGMGLDGHIASLFPGSKEIAQGLDLSNKNPCIAIDAHGCEVAGDYPNRMSLTMAAILKSELIILLLTGKEKLDVIQSAQTNNQPLEQPVAAILNQTQTPVEIYWAE